MTAAFALLMLLTAQAATPSPQAATPPTNGSPALLVPVPPDPATNAFESEAGLILVRIKPDATADYESIILALQEALARDTDPVRKAATKGWHVFKSVTLDPKTKIADPISNVLYVHLMLPAVPGFDYRPSLLVDTLVKELAPDLLSAYRDSFAVPPSKLDLTELAHMAVAPLPIPDPKTLELEKTGGKKPDVTKPEIAKPEVKKPEVKKPEVKKPG